MNLQLESILSSWIERPFSFKLIQESETTFLEIFLFYNDPSIQWINVLIKEPQVLGRYHEIALNRFLYFDFIFNHEENFRSKALQYPYHRLFHSSFLLKNLFSFPSPNFEKVIHCFKPSWALPAMIWNNLTKPKTRKKVLRLILTRLIEYNWKKNADPFNTDITIDCFQQFVFGPEDVRNYHQFISDYRVEGSPGSSNLKPLAIWTYYNVSTAIGKAQFSPGLGFLCQDLLRISKGIMI